MTPEELRAKLNRCYDDLYPAGTGHTKVRKFIQYVVEREKAIIEYGKGIDSDKIHSGE